MTDSLVILLHGVGSRGADMAPIGAAWSRRLPATAFAAPDAPFPFDGGGSGRQWFSIRGVTEADRPRRVAAARDRFDATVDAIAALHGFAERPERVALVGFSQGAIMTLDLVASSRRPFGAAVAFSGRLATPDPLSPSAAMPTLLIHGAADPMIAAAESTAAEERLRRAGARVGLHILPGVGHTVSAEGAALAADFLAGLFAEPALSGRG